MRPNTLYASPSTWRRTGPLDYLIVCDRADHVDCSHDRKVTTLYTTDDEKDALKMRKAFKRKGPVNLYCIVFGYMVKAIFSTRKRQHHKSYTLPSGRKTKIRTTNTKASEGLDGWRMTAASAKEWREKKAKEAEAKMYKCACGEVFRGRYAWRDIRAHRIDHP
jgi:hypothetical protein